MHEIETWAPGSAACALCVINISSHETGRPAGRGGGGPGPHGPPPGSATDTIAKITRQMQSIARAKRT